MHSEKRQRRDWIGRGEKGGSLRGRSGNRQHERARGSSISFSPPCASTGSCARPRQKSSSSTHDSAPSAALEWRVEEMAEERGNVHHRGGGGERQTGGSG